MSAPAGIVAFVGRDPEPGLEWSLTALRLGIVRLEDVLPVLPAWPLIILSSDARRPEPLVVHAADGPPLIAAFTSPDRTRGVDGRGRWQLWLRTATLAAGASNGAGLVINPGVEPTLTISPEQLAAIAAAPPSLTAAPAAHPPGSRALTALEQTIMAARAASTPRESIFDAVSAADLLVVSGTDPAQSLEPAAVDGALAVFTDEDLIPDALAGGWQVHVRGTHLPAMVGDRFEKVTIDPGTAYQLVVPTSAIPH